MASELDKDVYRTVCYFAFFEYPVTAFEITKWQLTPEKPRSYFEISNALSESQWLQEKLELKNGFYGIGNIDNQLKTRHDRFLNAVEKYKKLNLVLNYVARVPSVKGIALCNSLPLHFTRKKSDIDLFIISENGKVWSTRLLTVLPMILFRQRPGEAKNNPVDLSFFVTESGSKFEELKIGEFDPYMSMWIRSLVPVYEKEEGVFKKFIKNNEWAKEDLPKSKIARRSFRQSSRIKTKLPIGIKENFAKSFQKRKFPEDIRSRQNQDSRIVVTDEMLKFHKNDRREQILQTLRARMHV